MKDRVMNCPNCGAPVTGGRCEYCGTLFLDFGVLSTEKLTYIRIRTEKGFMFFRSIIQDIEMECDRTPELYACNNPVIFVHEPQYTLRFEAVGVPNENGLVFIESKKPTLDQQVQEMAGMEREL